MEHVSLVFHFPLYIRLFIGAFFQVHIYELFVSFDDLNVRWLMVNVYEFKRNDLHAC